MFKILISAVIALISVGCGGPRYVDYFPYHDDGIMKPKVALMPILDSSQHDLSWDLSEEISEGIYFELMNSGEFYVLSPKEIGPIWTKSQEIDFFGNDDSFVSEFKNTDFIVAMEIIERAVIPYDPCSQTPKQNSDCHPCNQTLSIHLRIKIIDVRFCEPKIVLYEVFKTCYTETQRNGNVDSEICWKDPGYSRTYSGIGHQRLIHNLAKRLEEVIWSAK